MFLLSGDIDGHVPHGLSFKELIEADGGFRSAKQQPASAKQGAVNFFHDVPLRLAIEIDHDVAAEDEIKGSKRAHTFAQVNRLKADQPPNSIT